MNRPVFTPWQALALILLSVLTLHVVFSHATPNAREKAVWTADCKARTNNACEVRP